MNSTLTTLSGWIFALVILWLWLGENHCNNGKHVSADTSHFTVQQFDTNWYTVNLPAPKPTTSTPRLPLPKVSANPSVLNIDTPAIIAMYYMANYYEQTIADTNIIATMRDSVWGNQITWRDFSYRLLRPTAITNTTIIKPVEARTKLFAGFGASVGVLGSSPTIGPELLLVSKNNTAIRAAYHFPGSVQASFYFKIGK